MTHIKILLIKWINEHSVYKKIILKGLFVILFAFFGMATSIKATAPTDEMKEDALWIRDTYAPGFPIAIVYPTDSYAYLYILAPNPTTGGNATAISNREIGTWPMNLNTQSGNSLIITQYSVYTDGMNVGCGGNMFTWHSATSRWSSQCVYNEYEDTHLGNDWDYQVSSAQKLNTSYSIDSQVWSNVGFYFNNATAVAFGSSLELLSSGASTVGGTNTNPGETVGGTLYIPPPPVEIPLPQNNYRLQYTTPGGLEWRIDSNSPCTLNQTTVNLSGTDYYPIECPNDEYNLFAKVAGQWYFAAPPVSQTNSYGLVEFLPETNTCTYITYINYVLVFGNNSYKVCNGTSNRIVDGLLPPLDAPIIDIPILDLGSIDLGQFEFLRPVFEWGVSVVNTVFQFFADAANLFLEFGYNAIRTILIVIIPDPSAIDYFFSGIKNMVSATFAGVQVFADFVVTPTQFSNVQANVFGETFTIIDWSWFDSSNISSSVKPVLDVSISLGIFIFSLNAFTNVLAKRKVTE